MSTKDSGKITNSMAVESKDYTMADSIMGIGSKGACMEGESTYGPTDKSTRDSIT